MTPTEVKRTLKDRITELRKLANTYAEEGYGWLAETYNTRAQEVEQMLLLLDDWSRLQDLPKHTVVSKIDEEKG